MHIHLCKHMFCKWHFGAYGCSEARGLSIKIYCTCDTGFSHRVCNHGSLIAKHSHYRQTVRLDKDITAHRCLKHEKWLNTVNASLFLLSCVRVARGCCVAVLLPAVKLAAVKYGVLTSGLRYIGLSAREMRDPGRGRGRPHNSIKNRRLGKRSQSYFGTQRRYTLCVTVGVPTFYSPFSSITPGIPASPLAFFSGRRVNLRDIQKFSCGWATS